MKFLAISGSHTENSQSEKAAKWLNENLESKGNETDLIDLAVENIPLWHTDAWNADTDLAKKIAPYLDRVSAADALILVVPEWGGMVPGALKNFLLYVGGPVAAHKPTLLVSVSAGRGGTYPIAELRMSGYKNNRMLYIPDHLIVQNCQKVMNDADIESGEPDDQYIKKRADHTLDVLAFYAKALKGMRESEDGLMHPDYPFGM